MKTAALKSLVSCHCVPCVPRKCEHWQAFGERLHRWYLASFNKTKTRLLILPTMLEKTPNQCSIKTWEDLTTLTSFAPTVPTCFSQSSTQPPALAPEERSVIHLVHPIHSQVLRFSFCGCFVVSRLSMLFLCVFDLQSVYVCWFLSNNSQCLVFLLRTASPLACV